MPNIHLKRLQQIISEEIKSHYNLAEGENRKSALSQAGAAAKCLDALEKYKEVMSSKASAELQDSLENVEKILNRIVASPLNYADPVPEEGDEKKEKLTSTPTIKKKTIKPKTINKNKKSDLL